MKKRMIPGWAIFILLFTLLFCANAEEEEKSRQYVLFSWEREMFSPEEETLDLYVAPLRAADCMLDDMHKRKIDMADEIFVINVDGYIGSSTRSEIEYAKATGKPIHYLEPTATDA